ncbi:MAG: hypothetical protein CMK89_21350 [Pseudomonadales bacterium]|nr:hypothetical protein [Pseudomonadales bacterium]
MKNEYVLDVSYFESKLSLVVRDCSNYTPKEMARELVRLALTAHESEAMEENDGYLERVMGRQIF